MFENRGRQHLSSLIPNVLIYFLTWCFSDLAVWRKSGNPSLLSRGSHLSKESTILEKQGLGQQRTGGRSLDGRIQRSVLPSQPSCSSGTPTCAVCCITLIIQMLRVTSLTHLILMQTLITLQTIQNYNAIRYRKYEFIVYLDL